MADEHGNIEVGIEIVQTDDNNLPKLREVDVVYLWHEVTALEAMQEIVLNLESVGEIPEGYAIVGIKAARKTQTVYDSAVVYNNNQNTKIRMDEIRTSGASWRFEPPQSLEALYSTQSAADTRVIERYIEATITYMMIPTGEITAMNSGMVQA